MSGFVELTKKGSRKEAELSFSAFKAKWGAKYRSVKIWADGIEDFNKQIRRMLKSTYSSSRKRPWKKYLVPIFLHYNLLWLSKRPMKGREHLADELLAD